MESFMDDLLNFSIPKEEEDEEVRSMRNITPRKPGLSQQTDPGVADEEDLEWLSNKDVFPMIETFIGVLPSENFNISLLEHEAKQLSPVSMLERSSHNSSIMMTTTSNNSGRSNGTATLVSCCIGFNVPVKARSKRHRTGRRDLKKLWTVDNEQEGGPRKRKMSSAAVASAMGRMCQHCGVDNTPQWRSGPLGPKTLCNACGVRYKLGRLVPEYRPVNSPNFSAELHSNCHRKIIEIKKQFMFGDGVRKDCG